MVRAIEVSIPLYESISEQISFFVAGPLRQRAVKSLSSYRQEWVLDSGPGPGTSSRLLVLNGFGKVVGLDPSLKLLTYAKSILGDEFHPVLAVSEHLPFRDAVFGSVLTCFALRDVRALPSSLLEFSRVVRVGGGIAVVDVGKPDGPFRRGLITLYVARVMPLLARLLVRNRILGNPFRMIVPTFLRLLSNKRLAGLVEVHFGKVRLREFMLGGLVIIEAVRG